MMPCSVYRSYVDEAMLFSQLTDEFQLIEKVAGP